MTWEIFVSAVAIIVSLIAIAKPLFYTNGEMVKLRCSIENLTATLSNMENRLEILEKEVLSRHDKNH